MRLSSDSSIPVLSFVIKEPLHSQKNHYSNVKRQNTHTQKIKSAKTDIATELSPKILQKHVKILHATAKNSNVLKLLLPQNSGQISAETLVEIHKKTHNGSPKKS